MSYKLINEFKEIIGDDPIFSLQAAVSPLFMIITWQEKIHPLHIFCLNKGRDSHLALNEKEYIAVGTDKFREYFRKETSLQDLKDEYENMALSIEKLYEEITDTDLASLSDDGLGDYMQKINQIFIDLARITIYIENVDYEKILGVVGNEYKGKLDDIWERATEAAFVSFENRRLRKMLDLVSSNSPNVVRKAKFIFTDYFWTKSESEISKALDDIKLHIQEKTKECERLQATAIDQKTQHEKWVETLDAESRRIAEYAQLVMQMRDLRKDPIAHIQAMLAEVSVVMMQRADIDSKLAPFVLPAEYAKGVKHLSSIKEEIMNRDEGCIYIANPDLSYSIEKCDFKEALVQLEEIIDHKTEKVDVLKGQVACRGIVRGTVRVVIDPHDDKGFQPGDILVTSMTRPEFVALMKMSGGVVTNEGGITCHAAIVSRELNIPCIIGTKIATKMLKDGDTVEVDANNGIVTVINK